MSNRSFLSGGGRRQFEILKCRVCLEVVGKVFRVERQPGTNHGMRRCKSEHLHFFQRFVCGPAFLRHTVRGDATPVRSAPRRQCAVDARLASAKQVRGYFSEIRQPTECLRLPLVGCLGRGVRGLRHSGGHKGEQRNQGVQQDFSMKTNLHWVSLMAS